jgi:hypothetical protein
MNPLELQVLAIVCGVSGAQNGPRQEAAAPRPSSAVPKVQTSPAKQQPLNRV